MMWTSACEREADVRAMMRGGRDEPDLHRHAAECDACRQTLAVGSWMQDLAAQSMASPEASPVSASALWWKAELQRRSEAERKIAAPFDYGEAIQATVGLAGVGFLGFWLWRDVPNTMLLLSRFAAWGATEAGQLSMVAIGVGVAGVAVTTFLAMRDRPMSDWQGDA